MDPPTLIITEEVAKHGNSFVLDYISAIRDNHIYSYGLLYCFVKGGTDDMPTNEVTLKTVLVNLLKTINLSEVFKLFSTCDFHNKTFETLLTVDPSTFIDEMANEMYKTVIHPLYSHNLELYNSLVDCSHKVLKLMELDEYLVERAWIHKYIIVCSTDQHPELSAYTDLFTPVILDFMYAEGHEEFFHQMIRDLECDIISKNEAISVFQLHLIDLINSDELILIEDIYIRKWVMSMVILYLLHGDRLIPTFDPTSYVPVHFQTLKYNEFFENIIEQNKVYKRKSDLHAFNKIKQLPKSSLEAYPDFIREVLVTYMLENQWVERESHYELDISSLFGSSYYVGHVSGIIIKIYKLLVNTNVSAVLEGVPDPRFDSLLYKDLSGTYVNSDQCHCRFEFMNPIIRERLQFLHEQRML